MSDKTIPYFWLISAVTVVITSSLTVTSFVTAPRLSCQIWRIYSPGGDVVEHKLPLVVRDRIEGMLGNHHPGPHPGVEVAVYPDDFRLLEHDGNRSSSRLRPVEDGIPRAGAMQVMQQAIGVQEFHRAADWHDHDARHEHALLLIHLHNRQGHRPFRAGRGGLEGHHDIANALLRGEDDVLGVLFFPAY
jgi:hypothetical protein